MEKNYKLTIAYDGTRFFGWERQPDRETIQGKLESVLEKLNGAPVVLVVLADRNNPNHVYDGSLVMGNLMLAAHALGVGSCWINRARQVFDSDEGKAILAQLGIEGDYEGVGNCILGYADGPAPEAKPRKENYVYYAE